MIISWVYIALVSKHFTDTFISLSRSSDSDLPHIIMHIERLRAGCIGRRAREIGERRDR